MVSPQKPKETDCDVNEGRENDIINESFKISSGRIASEMHFIHCKVSRFSALSHVSERKAIMEICEEKKHSKMISHSAEKRQHPSCTFLITACRKSASARFEATYFIALSSTTRQIVK